ncbi:unnamed protein product [Danaus chrysippus]|uniref:(African queen) hypothetical protein n=1 Tax=Danaus chrysippus TaxID=151541 RepID=A0A8J2R478_9NEOP|nr:unnamed protein product [Danaus chrysippus]
MSVGLYVNTHIPAGGAAPPGGGSDVKQLKQQVLDRNSLGGHYLGIIVPTAAGALKLRGVSGGGRGAARSLRPLVPCRAADSKAAVL